MNAASFAAGLVPGSLATAFVAGVLDAPGVVGADSTPLPTALGDVSVSLNGAAAPLHSVANSAGQEQVNFQVPFELQGQSSLKVAVTRNSQTSAVVDVPVLAAQPGVYPVAVHNADYSLVTESKPLTAGEYAFVYAEGLGPVQNQPPTGAAAPADPLALATTVQSVQVTLNGVACEVQYAGLAPGLVGVYQVNFRMPEGIPTGLRDLVVSVAGIDSPAVKFPVQ